MTLRNSVLVVLALCLCLFPAACGGIQGDKSSRVRPDSLEQVTGASRHVLGQAPPEEPPALVLNGRSLKPLAMSFAGRDEIPAADFDPSALTRIAPAGRLAIDIRDPGSPGTVTVRFFYSLGPNGLPYDTHDAMVECLEQCGTRGGSDRLVLELDLDPQARFVLIEIIYIMTGGMPQWVSYGALVEE